LVSGPRIPWLLPAFGPTFHCRFTWSEANLRSPIIRPGQPPIFGCRNP